jgi:choline-glycine betaine transporter
LSDLNIRVFLLLALFVFIFGPTWSIIRQAFNALGHYFTHLTEFSLVSVLYPNDPWPKSWTSFLR